jgi:hypothetical protein
MKNRKIMLANVETALTVHPYTSPPMTNTQFSSVAPIGIVSLSSHLGLEMRIVRLKSRH